jgi:Tfp pilus assembly protein PilO
MPTPAKKFQLEKIDEKTVKKIDTMESVSIIDIEGLRKQKIELEQEVAKLNKMLGEINEVITEFEKLP